MVGRQDGIALWESQNEGELTTAELDIIMPPNPPPTSIYDMWHVFWSVCMYTCILTCVRASKLKYTKN